MKQWTRRIFTAGALASAASLAAVAEERTLRLTLRRRVELYPGSGDWRAIQTQESVKTSQAALLLCDIWDKHWCSGAVPRVDIVATRTAPVVAAMHRAGIFVVHAPSETMAFYADSAGRKKMAAAPPAKFENVKKLADPALPIDDKDGGCNTQDDKFYRAWSRQHKAIPIGPNDGISDQGQEIFSMFQLMGIRTVFVAGVHTNMCILNRSFAIKRMVEHGFRPILLRDLTDAMYDPKDAPYVSQARGTELVVEHIEQHWCPTLLSTELLSALKR